MKIINESHPLFHKRIITYLEKYAPEPIKSLRMDVFVKKEKISTRELAWLLAILKRKCPYDDISWNDRNLCEYVDAIDNIFHEKITDEIKMCHNIFEISSLPINSRTEEIYKKLGISWEMTHDYKGKTIPTYWVEPLSHLDDPFSSISLRLIESVNADLSYKQKPDLLKEREKRANNQYRHNLSEKNLSTELIRNQRNFCHNNPVTLIIEQLPEKLWLKYIAHYLAVSSRKYIDYGDIDYDDQKLVNNAISIHKLLYEKLGAILGIQLKEWALMLPEHREIAKKNGVLDIAVIARKPEREIPDDWSVEVTKELALRLLRNLPEFNYLFDDKQENSAEHPPSAVPEPTGLPKPSTLSNYDTKYLYLAVEQLLEEKPDHDLEAKAIWNTLLSKENDEVYKIKSIKQHESKPRSRKIVFNSGHSTDYHAAQPHIKKVIEWFKAK